jgi:hypothetical protein
VQADQVGESVHATLMSGTPNQYIFRGLVLNDRGWIGQSGSDLWADLLDTEQLRISSVVGFWITLHPGDKAKVGAGPAAWYESRLDGGLILGVGNLDLDGRVVIYSSPNGSFHDIYELRGVLKYDDQELFTQGSPRAIFRGFAPKLTLAYEMKGARDGQKNGAYAELSVAPTLHVLEGVALSADLSFPISAGFSVADYYEFADKNGQIKDHALGFASFGTQLDIALGFVPERLGLWTLTGYFDAVLPVAQADAAGSKVDTVELLVGTYGALHF